MVRVVEAFFVQGEAYFLLDCSYVRKTILGRTKNGKCHRWRKKKMVRHKLASFWVGFTKHAVQPYSVEEWDMLVEELKQKQLRGRDEGHA